MDLWWHARNEVRYLPFFTTFLATLAICLVLKNNYNLWLRVPFITLSDKLFFNMAAHSMAVIGSHSSPLQLSSLLPCSAHLAVYSHRQSGWVGEKSEALVH